MATEPTPTDVPLPCPFCGVEPTIVERPDNIDGTEFFYAFACYCGGYSACAHKMAIRKTPELAKADAIAAWNRRAQPAPAASPGPLTPEQIIAAAEAEDNDSAFMTGFATGVRFAERHHGITKGA